MPAPDLRQRLVDRQSLLAARRDQRAARITLAEANLASLRAQHQIATGELNELAKVIAELPAPEVAPTSPDTPPAPVPA